MSTPAINYEHIAEAFEAHREDLMRYLVARTHDICDAEDILQDTFLNLLESETILLPATMRQLLFRVATNLFIDRARRRQKQNAIYSYLFDMAPRGELATEHVVLAHEVKEIESNVINMMAPKRQMIYIRIQHDGESPASVAADLGIAEKTVNSHLFFGRREVRTALRAVGF